MVGTAEILEQIRPLVEELNAEERLTLIRSIAQMAFVQERTLPVEASGDEGADFMSAEQEAWYAKPESERALYRGQYIAIYRGTVVDSDNDRTVLLRRVRAHYRGIPIPILSGDETAIPEYRIRSPQLIRSSLTKTTEHIQ